MRAREEYLKIVEDTLNEVLPIGRPSALTEAMRYAVGTGGKRIRPLICLAAAEAVGGKAEDARFAAAAIELLHNYTLVHDDLPAMDNDTLRRGKPTVWKAYGEANAILAGDALQALAFGVLTNSSRRVGEMLYELGTRAYGVVAGQVEDIEKTKDVDYIYEHKTADLFIAAAAMGAWAGGGDETAVQQLRSFALNLGLAFQYEDDLLDGDSPYSKERTEELVKTTTEKAIAALDGLKGDTEFLKLLATKLINRKE